MRGGMKLSRRNFLESASLAAIAAAATATPKTAEAANKPANNLGDWPSVRALFNLDRGFTHLALFIISSHPRPVRDAIDEYRKKLDADPMRMIEHSMFDFAHPENNLAGRAAAAIARYLH